jgi:biopolymer transport protein ExbD
MTTGSGSKGPSAAPTPGEARSVPPAAAGADMITYKRALRKEIRRRAAPHEANFLNITAMLDMMTIILVFLLKSMAQTSASLPQGDDLTLPKSVLVSEASQEGLPVLISKTQITVDDTVVCSVPKDATHGVEGRFKRSGANDMYIVPLANALQAWRDKDKVMRKAMKKSEESEALIIADKDTPYRLLTEVMFTLGQTEFAKFHLMVLQGGKAQ